MLKWEGGKRGHKEGPALQSQLDFEVAGQPGSGNLSMSGFHSNSANLLKGKSHFLSYLLARRLQRCQPTLYRRADDSCFLFNAKTAGKEVSLRTLFNLPPDQKRELWILTDEALKHPRWYVTTSGWFIVLGASPLKIKKSYQWEKDRNVGVHFMSLWSWAEIYGAYW